MPRSLLYVPAIIIVLCLAFTAIRLNVATPKAERCPICGGPVTVTASNFKTVYFCPKHPYDARTVEGPGKFSLFDSIEFWLSE